MNVKVHVYEGNFEETAGSLIRYLGEQKRSLAPTLAFIDPFGFTGMQMSTIAELLNHRACEIIVNFMIMYVNRFLEEEKQGANMNALFGLEVPEILAGYSGQRRVQHLHDVYADQLHTVAGFPYVQSFAMKNAGGNIEYYLFHGTRNRKGVQLMKDAMWRIDPLGSFTFDDRTADIDPLITQVPLKVLEDQVRARFQGSSNVPTDAVKEYAILYTNFRAPHLTTVHKDLEARALIRVDRPHRRAQFGPGVKINFL
jgi:hypothetical protein